MNGYEREEELSRLKIEGPSSGQDDSFSVYETVLNLKQAMGILEERSRSHERKLDDISRDVKTLLTAKTVIYTVAAVIIMAVSVIGWFLSSLIRVLQAFQSGS